MHTNHFTSSMIFNFSCTTLHSITYSVCSFYFPHIYTSCFPPIFFPMSHVSSLVLSISVAIVTSFGYFSFPIFFFWCLNLIFSFSHFYESFWTNSPIFYVQRGLKTLSYSVACSIRTRKNKSMIGWSENIDSVNGNRLSQLWILWFLNRNIKILLHVLLYLLFYLYSKIHVLALENVFIENTLGFLSIM